MIRNAASLPALVLLTFLAGNLPPAPAQDPERPAVLRPGQNVVLALAFSPDGKTLASGSAGRPPECDVKLWDVATGKQVATLKGHKQHLTALAYSPDGKTLASASQDGAVRLWDAAAGTERATLAYGDTVWGVGFSSDGKIVGAAGLKGLRLWAATGKELAAHKDFGQRALAFSPAGAVLAVSRNMDVLLWDTAAGKELAVLKGHTSEVTRLVFSPDGKRLASTSADHMVRVWDVVMGKQAAAYDLGQAQAFSLAYSPDGKTLAAVGFLRPLWRWDTATNAELPQLRGGPEKTLHVVAFSPDGKTLAVAGQGEILLFDVPAR
jgi:WD40 repeat protein